MGPVKQRVLEAAKTLYAEHGYQGLSMRKVAKAAGVSTMASYRHYENKEHLLHDLQVYAFSVYANEHLEPVLEIADPWEAVRANLGAYLDFALQNTPYFRIAFMATDEMKSLKTLTEEGQATIERSFRLPVQITGRAVGEEHAVIETIRAWAVMHGLVSLHLAGRLRFMSGDFVAFYGAEMDRYCARLRAEFG